MFLVVIDAHTKWPEVVIMKSTTAKNTVDSLRTTFARFGVIEIIVSDNGPQFVSSEFNEFLKINRIRQITSAPYHPSTNGLAERFVQSFKKGIKSVKEDQQKLDNFLICYRIAPQATTGQSPATLMLGRILRSRLDNVKPDLQQTVKVNQKYIHRRTVCVSQKLHEWTKMVNRCDHQANWSRFLPSES
jgi:transposase InsO family protein